MKTALITGIHGQDGYYLSKNLRDQGGYMVYGIGRRTSQPRATVEGVATIEANVTDASSMMAYVKAIKPQEIYHLAADSHVGYSFNNPIATIGNNLTGTLNMLNAADSVGARFYHAATSEMFGTEESPQDENTPFHPRSPYAVSKAAGYWATVNYREAFDLFACNGILFNHESEKRTDDFVTQKIVKAAVAIAQGRQEVLKLGNLDARRDWGHAQDYVDGMRLMLQQDQPDDYVLATGQSHSVREFAEAAFSCVHLDWQDYVEVDEAFMRPAEVPDLRGDPRKAMEILGWKRTHTFRSLVEDMIEAEIERTNREKL